MVTSGSLGGVMIRALAQNARDVGSIPALSIISPIVMTSSYGAVTRIQFKDQQVVHVPPPVLCAIFLFIV